VAYFFGPPCIWLHARIMNLTVQTASCPAANRSSDVECTTIYARWKTTRILL